MLEEVESATLENESETDSSQRDDERKSSISNLKQKIAALQKTQKMLVAILILVILLIDLLFKIFNRKK